MENQKEMPAEGSEWRLDSDPDQTGIVEYNDVGKLWRFKYKDGGASVWCKGMPGPFWMPVEVVDSTEAAPEPGVGSVDDIAGRIEAALVGLRESAGRAEAVLREAEVSFRLAAAEVARFEAALRALRGEEGSAPEAPIPAETRDPLQNPKPGDTWQFGARDRYTYLGPATEHVWTTRNSGTIWSRTDKSWPDYVKDDVYVGKREIPTVGEHPPESYWA